MDKFLWRPPLSSAHHLWPARDVDPRPAVGAQVNVEVTRDFGDAEVARRLAPVRLGRPPLVAALTFGEVADPLLLGSVVVVLLALAEMALLILDRHGLLLSAAADRSAALDP